MESKAGWVFLFAAHLNLSIQSYPSKVAGANALNRAFGGFVKSLEDDVSKTVNSQILTSKKHQKIMTGLIKHDGNPCKMVG